MIPFLVFSCFLLAAVFRTGRLRVNRHVFGQETCLSWVVRIVVVMLGFCFGPGVSPSDSDIDLDPSSLDGSGLVVLC